MQGVPGNNALGSIFNDPNQAYDTGEVPTTLANSEAIQDADGQGESGSQLSDPDIQSQLSKPDIQEAILGFQSYVRGEQARDHVSASPIGDSGIVHVQIKGEGSTFEGVGINGMNTDNGPKELHYLRVPSEGFEGHVVGGDSFYYDKDRQDRDVADRYTQQSLASKFVPEAKSHAFINGGYFNVQQQVTKNLPNYASIGETATHDGGNLRSVPVPQEYSKDYHTIDFPDGSKITSAPLLSEKGKEAFPQEKLKDPKYRRRGKNKNTPGILKHAVQPNPRSGVSIPGGNSSGDAYRLAVGVTPRDAERGYKNPGFTMPEWSTAMARLDRLNKTPKISLNLDGGASSALGVVNSDGEKLFDKRQDDTRGVPTLISFSSDPEKA